MRGLLFAVLLGACACGGGSGYAMAECAKACGPRGVARFRAESPFLGAECVCGEPAKGGAQ